MHMMSKPKYAAAALTLCAARTARVGLQVAGTRPKWCARGCLLRYTPLHLAGRALHARCARGMAVCEKNGLQRVDPRPSEGFVRSRSLDRHVRRRWAPSDTAPPRQGAWRLSLALVIRRGAKFAHPLRGGPKPYSPLATRVVEPLPLSETAFRLLPTAGHTMRPVTARTFTIGRPSSSHQDGDDADGPRRVRLGELEEVLVPVMILADRMGIMRVHTIGIAEPPAMRARGVPRDWTDVACEVVSQLTTVACGVLVGAATVPARTHFPEAFAHVVELEPPACVYEEALIELPSLSLEPSRALLARVDEAWEDMLLGLNLQLRLVAACVLLLALALCASVDYASTRGLVVEATPPTELTPSTELVRQSKRDSRRAYVSVEYEALVASTIVACKPQPPS
ncbi:hypothetical protein T492DRAFT_833741 [Pavlovales sp. CCMP2436]|nr:hypothetical protein T492DRAFT_833741 [Pavlovales sp. CCMP2436]